MAQFKISKKGIKEITNKNLVRSILFIVILVPVGFWLGTMNAASKPEAVNIMPIAIPLMLAVAGFGVYRGIKMQAKLCESYTLTVTNNLVTRQQFNTPDVSMYFNEVKEIVKKPNGGF